MLDVVTLLEMLDIHNPFFGELIHDNVVSRYIAVVKNMHLIKQCI